MTITSKRQLAWLGASLALFPAQGMGAAPESGDFDGYAVVSNQELAALRGGFELNIGGEVLSLAFSLERVTYLNGELQVLSRIVVLDLAAAIASPQSVSATTYSAPAALAEAGSAGAPIQNGTGNSVALPVQQSQQVSAINQQVDQALQAAQAQILQAQNQVMVIQNSLDNQVIQNMTTLNVTLSNAALARAVEMNAGLAQMLNIPVLAPR